MKAKLSFLARSVILLWMLVVGSVVHVDAKTVYFVNKDNWTEPCCHNWEGGTGTEWPGTKMVKTSFKIGDYVIYRAEIDERNKKCVFSNGGNSSTQTDNLDIPTDGKDMYYNDNWSVYADADKSLTNFYLWNTFTDNNWSTSASLELNLDGKRVYTITGNNQTDVHFTFSDVVYNDSQWSTAWRTNTTDKSDITIEFGKNYNKLQGTADLGVWNIQKLESEYNYTFTVDESEGTFVVTRSPLGYSVNVTAGEHGNVFPSGNITVGTEARTITATANTGYHFLNWTTTGDVIIANANSESTTITATGEGTVTANFEPNDYYLWHNTDTDGVWDAVKVNDGSCTISGDGRVVFYFTFGTGSTVDWSKAWRTPNAENTEITFGNTYSKSPAYGTDGVWFTNDFKTGYNYTFTINEDAGTFTVTKAEKTYSVTVNAGDHGSVSPSGTTQVGASGVSITATPASGYTFKEWQTTGDVTVAEVHSASTTITATGEGSITANFEEYTPTSRTVYYYNYDGYDDVYCYPYKKGTDTYYKTWPGIKMISVGNGIFKCDVPEDFDVVIFNNNKPDGDPKLKKSGDLELLDASKNFYTHEGTWKWSSFTEPDKMPTTRTVYYYNHNGWSEVHCHAWNNATYENNGGWPGVTMIEVGNGVYRYDVPENFDRIIFNQGNDDSQSSVQNIKEISSNFYTYENGDWKWSMYYAEPGLKYNHEGETRTSGNDACFLPFDAQGKATLTFTEGMTTIFSVFDGKDEYKANSTQVFVRNNAPVTITAAASGECKITADVTGDYVFKYDKDNHTITIEYPFAENVLPKEKIEAGKIAFMSKTRASGEDSQLVRSGWFWYTGQKGITHHMVLGGNYGGKTISYYDNKFGFSNCLPLANSADDNDDSWDDGIYYKLTSNGKRDGDGDVLKNNSVTYEDNIMYYEITNRISVPDDNTHDPVISGYFTDFKHLTAKAVSDKESVIKGDNVTITFSDLAGTLSVAADNKYIVYAVNSNGEAQKLYLGKATDSKITFAAPADAGQYKMHVFVQDPYGFELVEPNEEPITLVVNEQTYKVTYAKGDSDGGVAPIDNNAYLSGAEAIVLGNTGKLTKAGYNFIGWNTAADGSGTSYPVGSSITLGTEDVTLYPLWVNQPVPTISANYPSGTNFQSATDVIFTVTDANDVKYYSVANDGTETLLTLTDGKYNVANDVTIKVVATNYNGTDGDTSDDVTVTRVFKYTVGNVDEGAYYLVSPTLTGGKKLEQYKFNNVLHRNTNNDIDQNLLTLTVSDFMMRDLSDPANPGTAELADGTTFEYWIEKGDGTVVYYPKGGVIPGTNYYPGFNDSGKKYVYVYNTQYGGKYPMYISVDGGSDQPMTYVADASANGNKGFWCYELGNDDSYNIHITTYGISSDAQDNLKKKTEMTISESTQVVLKDWGYYNASFEHFNNVEHFTSVDNSEEVTATDYKLGFESERMFDAGMLVNDPASHTYVYTKTQMENYPISCNEGKDADATPTTQFTLEKTADQKSYTWYLNVGATPYDNAAHFTIPANGVAVAINNTIDKDDPLHAIKEVKSDGKYSYSLIGNTTKDSKNWADPATSKLEMQRIGFKDGKSFLYPDDDSSVACDSIVYTITITKPAGSDEWPKLFMAFTDQKTIDNFQMNDNWYQTPIRPQVFRDKDANVYFGGLEWNGVNTGNNSYVNEIGKPTDQTITPKDIDQFTSFVLHVNMTNATYWIAFNGETENPEDGFFICGPAVADSPDYENWTKKIKGENPDKTPNAAVNGNAVRMTYDPATESYVATLKLTRDKKFRFLDTSWDKAYYQEDAVRPASDGEPSNDENWKLAKTWETDYFNNTTNALTSTEVDNNGAIKFNLETGEYIVRFYFKKIKTATGSGSTEVFTYDATPYYTIDYHIGIGDATKSTDLTVGAGSTFSYHKTWSSRLAYVNDGLDVHYVSGWTWKNDDKTKIATASVTLSTDPKPAYLAANMPMILTGEAEDVAKSKTYVIVPGDPYGYQAAVKACYHENTGIEVRPIYETEDYTTGMNATEGSPEWNEWCTKVGPGNYDTVTKKYSSRNFIFGMISPNWRNDGKKELDFWRVKNNNNKMTGHKFLVVATVPEGTKDLESGKAFSSYQSGSEAKSMANYMTIRFEGEDDEVDSIVTGIAENIAEKAENCRIYNLMGVEVKTPVRGQVYIVNGRKVIMK